MVHERQRLPLSLEARSDLAGVHARLDDLHGDRAFDRPGLMGHVDGAHAAFTDPLDQLVRADGHAGAFPDDGRIDGGERSWPRRLVNRAHLGARKQQFLDRGAELNIARTGLVQEAGPLLWRVFFNRCQTVRFGLIARIAHDDCSRGKSLL
jgi:hypothetical protein